MRIFFEKNCRIKLDLRAIRRLCSLDDVRNANAGRLTRPAVDLVAGRTKKDYGRRPAQRLRRGIGRLPGAAERARANWERENAETDVWRSCRDGGGVFCGRCLARHSALWMPRSPVLASRRTASWVCKAQPSTGMEQITDLYNVVNVTIIAITIFVLVLMLYVMYRFSEKNNPAPSRTTHNTLLEVAWTIIPILILVGLSIPSFRLLYEQYSFPKPDVTIKATANAWFWDHEYLLDKTPGMKNVTISSNVVSDEDVIKAKLGDDKAFAARSTASWKALHATRLCTPTSAAIWAERKAAPQTGRRSGNRNPGQQERPPARDLERRHPFVDHPVVWRQAAGRSGPHRSPLVPAHQDRHVLRSMLGSVRQAALGHADRGPCC